MDQVKEYLGYAIKYRFWIVIAIAMILPLAGYFAAAGSVNEETAKNEAAIKSSFEAVKPFASNSSPVNQQYKPLVEQKTELLNRDVNASWRKLFDRQADLLTWPEAVSDRLPVWGPKWPEGQDPIVIMQAITDYVESYEDYYENEVFQTVQPFDFETGEGIVNAGTAQTLLRPPTFTVTDPPSLSEVWDTQRRFWVQNTVLDVVAKVNDRAGAKNWTTAPVKQILALDVASKKAQDQKSIAQAVVLEEAPEIKDPNAREEPAASPGGMSSDGMMGGSSEMEMMGSMYGMDSSMGMYGGMGFGGPMTGPQKFMILESPNPDQAFIVPLHLSVYIEQDRIPDLLVEFQNSPMNIEILDFAMHKPDPHSVKKPEKGEFQEGMYGMYGMYGMMPGMEMMEGGYGGGMRGMADMMMSSMYGMGSAMEMSSGMYGMGPGMGFGGAGVAKKKGLDVRQESLKKLEDARKARRGDKAEEKEDPRLKALRQQPDPSAPDPYYNVVRVEVFGRARFYLPPPVEEAPESEAETADLSELDAEMAEVFDSEDDLAAEPVEAIDEPADADAMMPEPASDETDTEAVASPAAEPEAGSDQELESEPEMESPEPADSSADATVEDATTEEAPAEAPE